MGRVVQATIVFVDHHQAWAVPIVFVLAFCESFAFVSLFVPATAILLGVGGLIAAAEVGFWPMWLAATSAPLWVTGSPIGQPFTSRSACCTLGRSPVIRTW